MASPSDDNPVIIVGAGIGGLSAALDLASRGHAVTVVEAGDEPGGKMRAVQVDGASIDAGPTVFTMRWVFDDLLASCGLRLDELVTLRPLSLLARHAWRPSDPGGHAACLDLHADVQRSADAIGDFASAQEAQRFLAFCEQAKRTYRRLEGPHIRSERPTFTQMVRDLGPAGLANLASLGPFATLWQSLGRHFQDPRLRQLFARYATYCGASPWMAPATLMLVAHVEMAGVWSIDGGMPALARALAGAASRRGVRFCYGQRVQRIVVEGGRVGGVQLADGTRLAARHVVFNGDVNALATGLLGEPVRAAAPRHSKPSQRSLSAVTWAMHCHTSGFPLARHNVFFDDDYESEFVDVFARRRLPEHGTVYVCAQDRLDDATTAITTTTTTRTTTATRVDAGRERLLALVNAPADGDVRTFDTTEVTACEQRSLELMKHCGLRLAITHPSQVVRRTPNDFARLHPGSGGALYGPAAHGWMSLFARASTRTKLPGLYLAGGSVHPGPGVPMAAMSGRLAAATLREDLDSTSRSRRVRIAGGTSTDSATTAVTPSRSSPSSAASSHPTTVAR
jgi:1-hydroxycarotenoid 3,4-desaturase